MAGKPSKPGISIVGAGNLASALAPALHAMGYRLEEIIARASSMKRAQRLARQLGTKAEPPGRERISADVVWFCVPDRAIATAAKSLVGAADWNGKVALHSSGALNSDELSALRRAGAQVASAHPLMTFVRGSRPPLKGVPFAVEGDARAVRQARSIVAALGGKSFPIRKEQKAVYHAWGMFSSPLLCALLAVSERVAKAAGVDQKAARSRMLPILYQTLANYARLGAAESFSGPIVRGDVETVKKHLQILRRLPEAREVYVALAIAALRNLRATNGAALSKVLDGAKRSLRR